jgi:hypothetical protein
MTTFKYYIKECIENNKDILVDAEHLDSITFTDICILIYLITTQNKKVELTNKVKNYLKCDDFQSKGEISLPNSNNNEELVLLIFITCDLYLDYKPITIYMTVNSRSFSAIPKYIMSPKFVEAAKTCGIYEYPITKKAIIGFRIDYDFSIEEGDAHFGNYMCCQKSARK